MDRPQEAGGVMGRKKVTIVDVAREAGVSVQTVSRVLNAKGEVSPRTREIVVAAIERLGYRPNGVARSLVTRRTLTIGLIVPDIANPFFPEIARGVEETAQAAGYQVFLSNTNEQPEREMQALHALAEKRVDGVILCGTRLADEALLPMLTEFAAVVLVNRALATDQADAVLLHDEAAMYRLVHWLVENGRRRLAFLAGPPRSYSGQGRRRGLLRALNELQGHADLVAMVDCPPFVDGGVVAAQQILEQGQGVDAFVCYNDLVALGALQACQQAGCAVPAEIAVTGFDDITVAGLVTPALTTMRVPKHMLGEHAARLLLERLAGRQEPRQVVVEPELVVRASAP